MSEKLKRRRKMRAKTARSSDENVEKQLAYVAEVSKNARTTWFGLIALMLFCGVTLLDVQDKDFFEYGASTQLPLINVSVPTKNFFWAAPLLVTGLYTYLHLYLDKLWRALARLDDEIDGRTVTEAVYPWLISDTALEKRPGAKRRPYWLVTRFVTFCLCWLVGPVIMGLFWWYSWAPHDERLTSLIGCQLVWLTFVGVCSWVAMSRRAVNAEPDVIPGLWFVGVSVFAPILWFIIAYGWAKTEDGRWWAAPGKFNAETAYLYSSNLDRANFVQPDKEWKGRDAAWREYQRKHRKNVISELKRELESEGKLTASDQTIPGPKRLLPWLRNKKRSLSFTEEYFQARLKNEFEEDRGEARAALERRAYVREDLRNANLREAFMPGVDLREANLAGANLSNGRLEGIDLRGARLEQAILLEARLESADLREINLDDANLKRAMLANADLREAALTNAKLGNADLENADLRGAKLENANLQSAVLKDADLEGAVLKNAELNGAKIETTKLVKTGFEGAGLTSVFLNEVMATWAVFDGADLRHSTIKNTAFDGAFFNGANLGSIFVENTTFFGAELRSARLIHSRFIRVSFNSSTFEKSDLTASRFEDSDLGYAEMYGAVVDHVSFLGTSLKYVRDLTQDQLEQTYGDASTDLSDTGLSPPDHWAKVVVPKNQRTACWRKWGIDRGAAASIFPPAQSECTAHADSP